MNEGKDFNRIQADKPSFVDTYLGIIVLGILFVAPLLKSLIFMRFNASSGSQSFVKIASLGIISVSALILVLRGGGIDMSFFGLMSMASAIMFNSDGYLTVGTLATAVLFCLIFGVINGLLCVVLPSASFIVTSFTGTIARALTNARLLKINDDNLLRIFKSSGINILVALLCALAVFIIIAMTPLGEPIRKRVDWTKNKRFMSFLTYLLSALLACIYGFMFSMRLGSVQPTAGIGNDELTMLCAALFAGASIYFDNRFAPVPIAILGALAIQRYETSLQFMNVPHYITSLFTPILCIIVVACDRIYLRQFVPSYFKRKSDNSSNSELKANADGQIQDDNSTHKDVAPLI